MSSDACVWNDTLCNELGVGAMLIDHISQRDISYNVGIDQAFMAGISINEMGTEWQKWLRTSLAVGFRAFYMDLTWQNDQWDLCPHLNETCASVSNVSSVINEFISQTDTNVEVDLLRLGLRFRIDSGSIGEVSKMEDFNMSNEVQLLQPRCLTPQSVIANQEAGSVSSEATNNDRGDNSALWPSLETTLLQSKSRVFITIDRTRIPSNISLGLLENIGFDPSSPLSDLEPVSWPATEPLPLSRNELARIPFRSVSVSGGGSGMLSDWIAAIKAGYSPVYNGSINYDTLRRLAPYCEWPWAPNEPGYESAKTRQMLINNQTYSMCGAQTENGWVVNNCHEEGHILCLSTSDSFDWVVSKGYTPFTATSYSGSCPNGYLFATPRSHLQSAAAKEALQRANVSWAWTPVNSLSLENCWVDGVNTYCPYNTVAGNRNGVALLVVVSVVGFCLVLIMGLLEYRQSKTPLRPQKPLGRGAGKSQKKKKLE